MSAKSGSKHFEQENQIQTLEKENKKLLSTCQELLESQVQVLKDATKGAEDIVEDNKKTIENGRKMTKDILAKAEEAATTSHNGKDGSLNVVEASGKTNSNRAILIEKRNKILSDLIQKYGCLSGFGETNPLNTH